MNAAEEVKTRLDVADIVQEYLQLKPAGTGSFRGLCPFHHEKSPSFFVNRPRQSWHCFGCNEGGDIISFVMRMEGMEFREALELLAQKAGVTLPSFDPAQSSQRKRLHEINELASKWFRNRLLSDPQADHARAYAESRQIDDLTGDLWGIGYAPGEWSTLRDALTAHGVTEDELVLAGLCIKREQGSGTYDRFRNRLMFTIRDIHGNVVGFTGRILEADAKEAKYVNTPETPVYKKSSILYGLDKAKGEIKRRDLAVIVEGNMDVVSSHRASVTNVICSSGTALTNEQLALIKRFTNNLSIAFDADAAGNAATLRGLDLARKMDFSIRVISLPPDAGKDPDDAIRKDPAIWSEAITHAAGIMDWLYRKAFTGRDATKPEEKKLIARDLLPEIQHMADAVERDAWLSRLASDLAVSADALREALRTVRVGAGSPRPSDSAAGKGAETAPLREAKSREEQLRERILALLTIAPELAPLAERLASGYPLRQPEDTEREGYYAMLADREFEDRSASTIEDELTKAATALREEYIAREGLRLEQAMRDAERIGDQGAITDLLKQYQTLNQG